MDEYYRGYDDGADAFRNAMKKEWERIQFMVNNGI